MKSAIVSALLGAAMLSQQVVAHPGHNVAEEAAERAAYFAKPHTKRSLAHCADTLRARGIEAAMATRRSARAEALRKKRSISTSKSYLSARDLDEVLATNHNMTGQVDPNADPATLFAGNNSCILTPEATEGPYYVSGELIRENIVEGQEGVALAMDIQMIDVNTCNPVPQAYLEAWHCNATGVYSGISASGNGNSDTEPSNLNATFMRGVQKSDDMGVVQFETIFPGHYTGRTVHIHVLAHIGSTLLPNNTITAGNVSHVGQIYFDQRLITEVERVAPYTSNTQELLTNAEDILMFWGAEDVDPVMQYVMLGDTVSDGLFAWIAFGIDTTASYNVSAAATLTDHGGVPNNNGGFPGGAPPASNSA